MQSIIIMDTGDFFTNIGKIYVVVAVIVVIFIGIMLYLWRLDRKTQQLEKLMEDGKET